MNTASFTKQVSQAPNLNSTERRVLEYLVQNRETALLATAVEMARACGTSDATIIRTTRRLGFSGLDALRQALAVDLKQDLSLSDRVDNSLKNVGVGADDALQATIKTLRTTLDGLSGTDPQAFEQASAIIACAKRVHVFGIGPSGYIAGYFVTQLARMGREAHAIRATGLQLADDIIAIAPGDALVALAYERPYPEITALFDHVSDRGVASVLITAPGPVLPDYRADQTLRVARGQADGFGLHAGTLALIEALLVAYAARQPDAVRASLKQLNIARRRLSGDGMGL